MVKHITLLVLDAPLDWHVVAEHLPDGFPERFSALNAVANFEFERLIGRIRGPRRRNQS
jgi:hypothetical protein